MAETDSINLPLLVCAALHYEFEQFRIRSEFLPSEVKHISSIDKLRGYKDSLMFVVSYPESYVEMEQYAKDHNIRLVKA